MAGTVTHVCRISKNIYSVSGARDIRIVASHALYLAIASLSAVLCLALPLAAQSESEPEGYTTPVVQDSINAADVHFERNLNTYLWGLKADYAARDTDFAIDLHDRFSSSLIIQDQNSFRDEQTFWLNTSRALNSRIALAMEASSFVQSDNQSLGVSDAALHSGLLGISARPLPELTISPLAGFRYDRQQDQADQGLEYKLLSQLDTVDVDGYETDASMRLDVSSLSPRYYRNNGAQVFFQKDFQEGSLDSLRFQWSNNRWDFYVPADTLIEQDFNTSYNIRSRVDEIFNVSNSLHYGAGNNLSAVVQTLVESRSISNTYRYKALEEPEFIPYDVVVQEQQLEGGLDINYLDINTFAASVGIKLSEREERHVLQKISGVDRDIQQNKAEEEEQLDNVARRTTLRGALTVPVSSSDLVSFESSAGILRYDTPDSVNTDDRDELLINLAGHETHRWNDYLEATLDLETTLNHIVYLFSDRSANNNWNRIFRLSPSLIYTPDPSFRMVNVFEVLANYTVFDFETIVPTVKSYSYRQFAFLDTTLYDISSRTGLDLFFQLRLYERGELSWSEFSESPQQYFREATFSPAFRYTIEKRLKCAVGFRSFAQNRFTYEAGTRVPDGNYFSYGPTTTIIVMLSESSRLEVQGWKEFQQETNAPTREVSNVTMSVKALF